MTAALFLLAATVATVPELTAFKPGETVLTDGIVRERIETCASNILHHLKVEESFVKPFRDCNSGDRWQFVGCGMLLDALVKAAAHGAGGQAMVDFKNHVLDEILAAQKEDGRLSIFPDTAHLGVWDNHDQAYFLQGLCREWEYFGNARALLAAKRLGNYLISPERRTKVNLGIETAFVLLYRATGDERYRDYLRDGFGMLDGMVSYAKNLIDAGVCHGCPLLHVYSWQARALAEVQYADVTGDRSPALACDMDELWRRAFSPATSISGTMSGPTYEHRPSWGEMWNESNAGLGSWGETCVSAYSLRTLQYMFTKRAEPRFGDLYERVMHNAFFAAMSRDGTNYRYFTPFAEKGVWYDRETYCCPNNFRREIFEIPDSVFFRTDDGLAVNVYVPAKLCAADLSAELKTGYPATGVGELTVGGDGAKVVWLRIPGWCDGATVRCGADEYRPAGGTWLKVALGGNRRVTFDYPMPERFVKGQRMQSGKVARMRGPVVFGLDADGATVRFADERRVSTYFTPAADAVTVDDELFSPVRWRGVSAKGDVPTVSVDGVALLWRTYEHDDFVVLENSSDQGKTWKVVLIADPDYEGPVVASKPTLAPAANHILLWSWTQDGQRLVLRLKDDEEYPSVMRDQAKSVR